MTVDLATLFNQLVAAGFLLLGWAVVVAIWMWLYYLWKTEIQPLAKGLRWRKTFVAKTSRGYELSYYDWVDPKTYKGPGEEPETVGLL